MSIAEPDTRQFLSFKTNLEYARNLITAGNSLRGLQPGALDINDLYRAAWVQGVSAIDHWLHEELFRRVAEISANSTGGALPAQLRRFELPLSVIEDVRVGQQELADVVVAHVRAKWAYAPLHNPKRITEAYRLITDEDLWASAATKINAWHHHRTHYSAQSLKQQFSAIIQRRNLIAHYADLEDGHLKRRRPITDAEASDALNWIERIALAIAAVLG
ncbi:hypothetical protein [Streptomyces sp. NBC_01306]|uniref:hypothetical protein n=1 Tax=Streptomyces sp. NBC_01306 TaxID=2903819 RepID=UPI00224E079D|nr:hypothetical protein [Streptomyces sp. NBC_01306]MCX4724927.1 hypothetical protein [Streptomyces sp. NBC_01306]